MRYQQGNQRIEIIVRKEGGDGTRGANTKDTDQVGGEQQASTNTGRAPSNYNQSAQFARVNTTHTLAVVKQWAGTHLNYYVQGIGLENGDQALQENVARRVEIFNDVGNAASNIAMGITYGAAGGVPGMAIGAVLGIASSAISIGYKYAGRKREFDYKQFKENNAIEYQRARASINLTTGRLR